MRPIGALVGWLGLAGALAGCGLDTSLDSACRVNEDCTEGRACLAGRCAAPLLPDGGLPPDAPGASGADAWAPGGGPAPDASRDTGTDAWAPDGSPDVSPPDVGSEVSGCPATAPDRCGEMCIDLRSSRTQCGRCDNNCTKLWDHADMVSCNLGECRLDSCAVGYLAQGGSCVVHEVFAPPVRGQSDFCLAGEECRLGDVDGDGRDDLVAFVKSSATGPREGDVFVSLAQGRGFGPPSKVDEFFCVQEQDCLVADMNGDKRDDLVRFTRGPEKSVWVRLSTRTGFAAAQNWGDYFCLDKEWCELGDVNGDGKADAVVFLRSFRQDFADGWVYVEAAGNNHLEGAQKVHEQFCVNDDRCALGDLNGDGKADLLAFSTIGRVSVALATGTGTSTSFGLSTPWTDNFCVGEEQCLVGDVNGDGKADLLAIDSVERRISVGLSTGTSIAPPRVWLTGLCGAGELCRLGDVDGDKKLDLVSFTRNATADVHVARSVP